jgi:hypothetical protein
MARDEHAPETTDEPPFRFPASVVELEHAGLCPECYASAVPAPRVEPEPDEAPNV